MNNFYKPQRNGLVICVFCYATSNTGVHRQWVLSVLVDNLFSCVADIIG